MPAMPPTIIDIASQLPSANEGSKRARNLYDIRLIAVHYDAVYRPDTPYDALARYASQARYHISKNWGTPTRPVRGFGLMYHYRIAGDGTIYRTQPEALITWHAREANNIALGVCLDCGERQKPTPAQLEALRNLLDWLCHDRPDIRATYNNVYGHKELTEYGNKTLCPGEVLPYAVAYREGKWGRQADENSPVRFIPETGYYVAHGFLDVYKRVNKDEFITGYPLSNEYADPENPGLTVQEFENVWMEYRLGQQPRIGGLGMRYAKLRKQKGAK